MPVSRRARVAALTAALPVTLLGAVTGTAVGQGVTCAEFAYQEDAQAVLAADRAAAHGLDEEGDGRACASLPSRGRTAARTASPSPTPETPTTTPPTAPTGTEQAPRETSAETTAVRVS
jgi:hypothetical protein